MARIDDGLLFLTVEGASEDQLRRGLAAARQRIARSGVYIEDAMEAAAKRNQERAWERGEADHPGELTDEDYDNADLVDEAWLAALLAAGADAGEFGMMEPIAPAMRDLFECAS